MHLAAGDEEVGAAYENCASHEVSEADHEEIEEHRPHVGCGRSKEEAEAEGGHVGHDVFKAGGDEGEHTPAHEDHLGYVVAGTGLRPDGEADEDVAHDAAEEERGDGLVCLEGNEFEEHGSGVGSVAEGAGGGNDAADKDGSEKISEEDETEGGGCAGPADLAESCRLRECHHGAGGEFSAGEDDEDEAEAEHDAGHQRGDGASGYEERTSGSEHEDVRDADESTAHHRCSEQRPGSAVSVGLVVAGFGLNVKIINECEHRIIVAETH